MGQSPYRRGWLFLTVGFCIACSSASAPELDMGPRLIFVAGSSIRAMDPGSGKTSWIMPLDGTIEGVSAGPESGRMFVSVVGAGSERELLNVDLCSRRIDWRLAMFQSGEPNVINDVGLSTGEVMSVHPVANVIYLWRSWKADTLGIASVDLGQRVPTGFSGPWNTISTRRSPRCGWPTACLVRPVPADGGSTPHSSHGRRSRRRSGPGARCCCG